jgi:hypothetical protein
MPEPNSAQKVVSQEDYLFLASLLEGKGRIQRVHKKEPHGQSLRNAGEMYGNREYVSAYECLKPAYDKVVSDMERILARNLEFEANKVAREQRKPLSVVKRNIQSLKAYAQQVIDELNRLLQDLTGKPLVRVHIKKCRSAAVAATPLQPDSPSTSLVSATETRLDTNANPPIEVIIGDRHYRKAPYVPPEKEILYSVRDKARGERIIRVIAKSPDGSLVQVETLEDGRPSKQPIQLTVDSLARQAEKGWCNVLLPVAEKEEPQAHANQPAASDNAANVIMRLDIQNFGRCCADIARANIRFDTQLIKDVGDGPFRAGHYEQAFLTFEQFAVGFSSAVASSRRAIADGRRALTAEKRKLSGKEIQERNAAFVRNEQLIHTAEREFSKILEGLRMYLRTQQE